MPPELIVKLIQEQVLSTKVRYSEYFPGLTTRILYLEKSTLIDTFGEIPEKIRVSVTKEEPNHRNSNNANSLRV